MVLVCAEISLSINIRTMKTTPKQNGLSTRRKTIDDFQNPFFYCAGTREIKNQVEINEKMKVWNVIF